MHARRLTQADDTVLASTCMPYASLVGSGTVGNGLAHTFHTVHTTPVHARPIPRNSCHLKISSLKMIAKALWWFSALLLACSVRAARVSEGRSGSEHRVRAAGVEYTQAAEMDRVRYLPGWGFLETFSMFSG